MGMGQTPILILKEGTKRDKGKDAQYNNIMAARAIADAVRSTLGPRGMDKMLVDSMGDVVITNDGVFGGTLTLGNGSMQPNQLIITNGGKVFILGEARVGSTSSTGNLLLVSGPTSLLSVFGGVGGLRVGAGISAGAE